MGSRLAIAGSELVQLNVGRLTAMDPQVGPGFSKGLEYDQHRAIYADDAVEKLLQSLQVSGKQNARILDLAAGTGKFTEALARRPEQFEILAVEPLENLRDILAQKKLPGVTVADGEASRIPVEDATIDAVVVAQVSVLSLLHGISTPHLRVRHAG